MECYLDNCATTKVYPEVADEIYRLLNEEYGNPSSLHKRGRMADEVILKSRSAIAQVIGASREEIFFNSCASEGNNQILKNFRGKKIITTEIEHPSVRNTLRKLEAEGTEVIYLKPDGSGRINLDELESALTKDTALVSIMHVNNEIGSVNDLEKIGKIIKEGGYRARFHADCVQSFLKFPIDVRKFNLDFITASAHKVHGPKGIGFIYIRKGLKPESLISGGGQEMGLRAGTHNVPYIGSFKKICEILEPKMEENMERVRAYKNEMISYFKTKKYARINGDENGSPYILNVSFTGLRAEILLRLLEEKEVYVSTGSACSEKNMKDSHVLSAIGLKDNELKGSIRMCFSDTTTEEEIKAAKEAFEYALGFAERIGKH